MHSVPYSTVAQHYTTKVVVHQTVEEYKEEEDGASLAIIATV
jgi:hypothetical protein